MCPQTLSWYRFIVHVLYMYMYMCMYCKSKRNIPRMVFHLFQVYLLGLIDYLDVSYHFLLSMCILCFWYFVIICSYSHVTALTGSAWRGCAH